MPRSAHLFVEAGIHNRRRNDNKECDDCDYAVAPNKGVVFGDICKAIAHSCLLLSAAVPWSHNWISGRGSEGCVPLYRIVSKFSPTRLGSKKSLRFESQVPSPTYNVFEEYVLEPAGDRPSWGAMRTAVCHLAAAQNAWAEMLLPIPMLSIKRNAWEC